jgi:uncharacterized membrane-anchored protein
MDMKLSYRWFALALVLPALYCAADEQTQPAPTAPAAQDSSTDSAAAQFESSLHYKTGTINLPSGFATFALSDRFRFLEEQDAKRLLVQAWGNPPDAVSNVLGMIVRSDAGPLDRDGWGVVVTYEKDGYVKDDDAAAIDYDKLLKEMQEASEEGNAQRRKQGYSTVQIAGWAERPFYDAAAHKLYWAKELRFSDAPESTLNYDIRVLGRHGVLSLNAVAGMRQLQTVKTDMQEVLGFTEFSAGHRYTEFNSSTDKVAAYGVAALVAGGVAAKMGLFAKLGILLLSLKKGLVFILAGAGALAAKFFKRDRSDS